MRVKTFRGESMQAVLAQVRQELGPEAVILGSQTVRENGTSQCELMAALEQDAGQAPAAPAEPAPDRAAARAVPTPGADWSREWDEIKGHLLALLRPRLDFNALTPRQRLALEFLEREGVDESVIVALYRSIVERGETTVMPALSRMLPVKPLTPDGWPAAAHVFLGPSGVGKTTTLLRLALAARALAPNRRVVVANADGGRGKGRLLLRHYAQLSGLTYAEVNEAGDFADLLAGAAEATVYVDTPSFRREGEAQAWWETMGLADRADLAAHLVLSPLCTPIQTAHFWRAHRVTALSSCIWTKLDEACSYGSLVNVAHTSSLPVSVLTFGPELTQGMAPASGKAVWKLLFKHQLPGDLAQTANAGV